MNSNDFPEGAPPGGEPGDRRKTERMPYAAECELTVTAPAWAMTKEPIISTTENITLHGARLKDVCVEGASARSWEASIRDDIPIEVEVRFPILPGSLSFRGSIVWVGRKPEREEVFDVGILFDIPRDEERAALEELMKSFG